jgi:hypothetical protein
VTVDDPLLVLLDIVLERRWQLVSARQKTLCRIHDQLAYLLPGGAEKHLTADKTAALLRRIRPTDPVGIHRRLIVRELLTELRALERKIAPLDADIAWMLDEHGTRLTEIVGIGRTGAARARPTPKRSARSSGTSPPRSTATCTPTPRPAPRDERWRRRRTSEAESSQVELTGNRLA